MFGQDRLFDVGDPAITEKEFGQQFRGWSDEEKEAYLGYKLPTPEVLEEAAEQAWQDVDDQHREQLRKAGQQVLFESLDA